MTCSLENYRQKIGTYQQRPLMKRNFKYNSPRTIRPKLSFKILVPIFTYCLGILFLPYALEYYPPTCVPNPDSCSSTPPPVFSETPQTQNIEPSNPSGGFFLWLTKKEINKNIHLTNGNKNKQGYKYFAWNCDKGFISENKIEDLKIYALKNTPHIMSVTEINISKNENNTNEDSKTIFSTEQVHKVFQIPGYEIILPVSWQLYGVARILVYVHEEINYKVCELNNDEKHLQTVTLEVGFGRASKHFVNMYYREWKSLVTGENSTAAQAMNLKKLMNIWTRASSTTKDFVALGDMNLCALNWNENGYNHATLASIVQDFMLSENCYQLINSFTRVRQVAGSVQRSCLDHITTNCISKMSSPEVIGISRSDHLGISIVKLTKEIRHSPLTTKKRIYKNFCRENFLNDIREAKENGKFQEVFESGDIDEASEIFAEAFNEVLEKHAPLRVIQNRKHYVPYITEQIREAMGRRDKLKKKAAETGGEADYNEYKVERNKVTKMLRSAKQNYYDEKFSAETASSAEIWKAAYSLLGNTRSGFPSQIMINGKLITKPIHLATEMNKFFIKKIANLKNENNDGRDGGHDGEQFGDGDATGVLRRFLSAKQLPISGFNMKEISTEEMKNIIKGMKGKKSCGLDWICGFSLKIAAYTLCEELKFLTNLSIRNGKFASHWKKAKVLPAFKNKGSKYEADYYRPLSNLSEVSKLTERAVHSQVYRYFEDHNLFHPNHHGFLRNHSTTTAVQQIFDYWMKSLDEGKFVGSLLLDLSAGFDVIDLDILLEKLVLYGFRNDTLKWFSSYLKERHQCVQVESAFSPFLPISWGIPQGSILGPLIFLIFINEMPDVARKEVNDEVQEIPDALEEDEKESEAEISEAEIVVFADDNTPMITDENPKDLQDKLEVLADKVTKWFHSNHMIVSGEKTKLIVTSTAANRRNRMGDYLLKVKVDGHEQIESDSEKLLGMMVNKDGNWKTHLCGDGGKVKGLLQDLSKRIGMLKNLRKNLSTNKFKILISGLFTSKMTYGIAAWGTVWGINARFQEENWNSITMRKVEMKKLQVLQNSTLRLLLDKKYDTPTSILLGDSKSLSVNQMVAHTILCQVWKIKKSAQPEYHFERLFGGRPEHMNIGTRSAANNDLQVNFRLSVGRGSFFYLATNLWNSIPTEIRDSATYLSFKTAARKWTLSRIPMKI